MKKLIIAIIISTIIVNDVFSEVNRELIRDVFEATGIIEQINSSSEAIPKMFEMSKNSIHDPQYLEALKIIAETFTSTNYLDQLYMKVENNYREDYLLKIKKVYESDLFKRITESEIVFEKTYNLDEINTYDLSVVESERLDIFTKFVKTTRMVEDFAKIAIKSLEAFIETANLLVPENERLSSEAIVMILNNANGELLNGDKELEFIKKCAIMYEGFSNDEIEYYLSFYSTDAEKWLHGNLLEAMEEAVTKLMRKAAGRIVTELNYEQGGI